MAATGAAAAWAAQGPVARAGEGIEAPFSRRLPVHPFPANLQWINVARPIELRELRGKFVLLDFWTLGCINCMHIIPELRKLEKAWPNELVVIGVHSAKFESEKDTRNIKEAVLRYRHRTPGGQRFAVRRLEQFRRACLAEPGADRSRRDMRSGATAAKSLSSNSTPCCAARRRSTAKMDCSTAGRCVSSRRPRKSQRRLCGFRARSWPTRPAGGCSSPTADTTASSSPGWTARCWPRSAPAPLAGRMEITRRRSSTRPQGMALAGETLYVADTWNHLIRKVDLAAKRVTTVAGTGQQSRDTPPMGRLAKPLATALSSPWDLLLHDGRLYIAMAGLHQIWVMRLDKPAIGVYAGNGVEDIVDGPIEPRRLYQPGQASFAQPSGLASDGQWLYVADSEGSSIRAVPFDARRKVWTVVGTAQLPAARLFTFGDVDGQGDAVRLQHPLGLAFTKTDSTWPTRTTTRSRRSSPPRARRRRWWAAPRRAERRPAGVQLSGRTRGRGRKALRGRHR